VNPGSLILSGINDAGTHGMDSAGARIVRAMEKTIARKP